MPAIFSRLSWQSKFAKSRRHRINGDVFMLLRMSDPIVCLGCNRFDIRTSALWKTAIATSLPFSAGSAVESIIRMRSNTIMSFPLSRWQLNNHYIQTDYADEWWHVSNSGCLSKIEKKYLTHRHKFCIDWQTRHWSLLSIFVQSVRYYGKGLQNDVH